MVGIFVIVSDVARMVYFWYEYYKLGLMAELYMDKGKIS